MTSSHFDQQDLIQEAMIKMFEVDGLHDGTVKIALKNHMIDTYRKQKKTSHREVSLNEILAGKNYGFDYICENAAMEEIFYGNDLAIAKHILDGYVRRDVEYIGFLPSEYQKFRRNAKKVWKQEGWI